MLKKLKGFAVSVKAELKFYKELLKDKRTPLAAKLLLAVALGYILIPIDLIPDFIPVLGYLDDVIIVALFVIIALKFIPKDIVESHRNKTS